MAVPPVPQALLVGRRLGIGACLVKVGVAVVVDGKPAEPALACRTFVHRSTCLLFRRYAGRRDLSARAVATTNPTPEWLTGYSPLYDSGVGVGFPGSGRSSIVLAMAGLSAEQVDRYERDGYLHPIDVMTEAEAGVLRERFEKAERDHPDALHAEHRNNAHYVFEFLADVASHPAILDAVRPFVGDNILLSTSVLFIKEPTSTGFVSWHQDGRYMGLSPHDFVTAWLAITPSTVETGCMMVIPGSHHDPIRPHVDTFAEDNILTRGQYIDEVDVTAAVPMELRAGQISLHHPRLVHGSAPNVGTDRRIGLALQSYLAPTVRPASEDDAMLVAGSDVNGHFRLTPRPVGDCAPEAVEYRAWSNNNMSRILYEGAEKVRRY